MFKKLYLKTLIWSEHKYAVKFLAGLSFIEAIFFPVPPDVMLAPMTLAKPQCAWYYARITILFSVLGGIFGYLLGYGAYHILVKPIFEFFSIQQMYFTALDWFEHWGVWVILIAAFTPVPYKIFTIAAGSLQMNFWLFVLASVVGRGARFYLVAAIFKFSNKYLTQYLQRWIDITGWGVVAIIAAVIAYLGLSA